AQTPTWSSDIACLVYNKCAKCHNDNGVAPFPLLHYDDIYPLRDIVRQVVNEGIMPPWPPAAGLVPLHNDRSLSPEQVQLINDWVDAGAPFGDPQAIPAPPTFDNPEVIPDPDLVVQLPENTSQATTEDEYRCFVLPSNLAQDMFVTGYEVVPGNRSIVHHVLVFQDPSNQPILNDQADPGPGYLCFGGVGSDQAELVGGWVPGSQGTFFPENMGVRLEANTNIVVQLHYPAGTAGQTDDTKINFKLTANPGTREVRVTPFLNHVTSIVNGPLYIPANTVRTFREEFLIPHSWISITLLGAAPHMHLIGRSIRTWAELPGGDTLHLMDIPEWDFEWQGFYAFKDLVLLPGGSKLVAEATYDNTPNNPHNPNDPPQDVWVGEATTDEMMLVYFPWVFSLPGDGSITFDDDPPFDCSELISSSSSPT
ncbi:MAG: hypothetical protein D6765_08420, partial [Bacteroidetes bacterium]